MNGAKESPGAQQRPEAGYHSNRPTKPITIVCDLEHQALHAKDRIHERHIRALGAQCVAAYKALDRIGAQQLWNALISAINARSQAQVAHMERRLGLR